MTKPSDPIENIALTPGRKLASRAALDELASIVRQAATSATVFKSFEDPERSRKDYADHLSRIVNYTLGAASAVRAVSDGSGDLFDAGARVWVKQNVPNNFWLFSVLEVSARQVNSLPFTAEALFAASQNVVADACKPFWDCPAVVSISEDTYRHYNINDLRADFEAGNLVQQQHVVAHALDCGALLISASVCRARRKTANRLNLLINPLFAGVPEPTAPALGTIAHFD